MKRPLSFFCLLISMLMVAPDLQAQRGGRGGGANRGGGSRPSGGGFQGGGGRVNRPSPQMQRPATRPAPQRPASVPQVSRPNVQRPQVSRPNVQQPQVSRPNVQRPANLPSQTINRPSTRPSALPGTNRPATRPSIPGNVTGNRPDRPTTRPTTPGGGTSIPGMGNISRPTTRPGVTTPGNVNPGNINRPGGINRPNLGNNISRPKPGDLGDFLGMDKPIRPGEGGGIGRPDRPTTLPGKVDRPGGGIVNNRPDRPTTLPGKLDRPDGGNGINRPNLPGLDRPGGGWIDNRPNRPITNRPIINKPINVGNNINNVINNKPSWVNINNNRLNVINNNWNTVINRPGSGMHNWATTYPGRVGYWNGWGNGIRTGWHHHHYHSNWFGANWWGSHPFRPCGWHYHNWLPYYPYNYWWTRPAWTGFATWFTWGAVQSMSQPIYYDYGTGGNITYQDNRVFVGGQEVASSDEFAQSAAALATVDPPASEEIASKTEWLPLGTFALSTGENDKDPSRVLQLAVNKDGIIGGTLFNLENDTAQAIQGRIDKDTQRVALRFGEKDNIVAETGLYNLTQDEAPLLVHFGADKREQYLLVRLDSQESEENKGDK